MQSLRILHIISGDRWAGAEVQAYTLLKELAKQHAVHAVILNPGELASKLQQSGVDTLVLDESTQSSAQIFRTLCQHIKKIKPQIIHTHRQKENILGSIANLLTVRTTCVRTVHGAPEFVATGKGKLQIMLDTLCGKYLQQAIIAVSDDLKGKLSERFPVEKLHTVVNGIDVDEVRQNLATPDFKKAMPDAVHIGIVGRLDPVKRIDIFLETAALLLKDHPATPWQFHIFGEGKLDKEMKALARSLGIESTAIFHGHRMDIRNCINGLDAVVMCSDHEGLPMTALECLALGTPIVAHSVGGLTPLLAPYPHWLVTQHNAVGYQVSITSLKLPKHSENAPPFPNQYRANSTAEQTAALYYKLVNNRAKLYK